MLVAVYGSLKRGFGNYHCMDRAKGKFITEAISVRDDFIMAGSGFPYVVSSSGHQSGHIMVELFEVSDEGVVTELDTLEGHPTFYKREEMEFITTTGEVVTAWVYIYQGNITADTELLEDGVYVWKESW